MPAHLEYVAHIPRIPQGFIRATSPPQCANWIRTILPYETPQNTVPRYILSDSSLHGHVYRLTSNNG